MFTDYTYQDWMRQPDKVRAALSVVSSYRHSDDFEKAGIAQRYYFAENDAVSHKVVLRAGVVETDVKQDGKPTGEKKQTVTNEEIPGNRIYSDFFRRFVLQESQYLLGNGVTLDEEAKARLGNGFDTALAQMGVWALVHGVCWGYWNYDHIEVLRAYTDEYSGFVALLDEITGAAMVGVQFWQLSRNKPLMIRVFETDGVTLMGQVDEGMQIIEEKRPYKQTVFHDSTGSMVIGGENYNLLPVIPLYANEMKRTELSLSIRSKIDLYDRILSDFGDNLDKANDVYWVLNNYGGTTRDIAMMLETIHKLKAIVNVSDGSNSSTATPQSFEVPYAARSTALDLLEKALYKDYMATNMSEITGGSLTNVAIETATMNLNLKVDAFEWQVFSFVQGVLSVAGIETERISFQRRAIANGSEVIQNIYTAQGDLDRETRLKLNPMVANEDIPEILERLDAEETVGLSSIEAIDKKLAENGAETGHTDGSQGEEEETPTET